LVELPENKHREGLGFVPSTDLPKTKTVVEPMRGIFHSSGFIHTPSEANAITEDDLEGMPQSFVTPGGVNHNWDAVDVPFVAHLSK